MDRESQPAGERPRIQPPPPHESNEQEMTTGLPDQPGIMVGHETYPLHSAETEMVIEEVSGQPVQPKELAAGIASMEARIKLLTGQKGQCLAQMDTATGPRYEGLSADLVSLNAELSKALARLAHYRALQKQAN